MHRSSAQTSASRDNGANSQGPKSAQGKARAAANSVKHGLCAKEFRLTSTAEQERFAALLDEFVFLHQAVTDLQIAICRRLAVAHWRQEVCDNLEGRLWQAVEAGEACFEAGGAGFPGMAAINRYRARLARDVKEATTALNEAKRLRAEAFAAQMQKQQELQAKDTLKEVIAELGPTAFQAFRETVANKPPADEPAQQPSTVQTNPSRPEAQATPANPAPCANPQNARIHPTRPRAQTQTRQTEQHIR